MGGKFSRPRGKKKETDRDGRGVEVLTEDTVVLEKQEIMGQVHTILCTRSKKSLDLHDGYQVLEEAKICRQNEDLPARAEAAIPDKYNGLEISQEGEGVREMKL